MIALKTRNYFYFKSAIFLFLITLILVSSFQNCIKSSFQIEKTQLNSHNNIINDDDDDDDDDDIPKIIDKWPITKESCLNRSQDLITTLTGTLTTQYRIPVVTDGTTFDFRDLITTAYPFDTKYPMSLGPTSQPKDICVIGGNVSGQLDHSWTWTYIKSNHDGDGMRIEGRNWFYVDGLRVDNVEDGLSPRGPQTSERPTLYARNLYFTYIRDDCIENDACLPARVQDSLFDGCYMGVSERPGNAAPCDESAIDHTFEMENVLLRLQAMPREDGSDGTAHGHIFKWTSGPYAGKVLVKNSIFLVEEISYSGNGPMGFPEGTIAENVTLVWLGPGDYPAPVPNGVTVTKDISIWQKARSEWLTKHGYDESK